MTRKTEQDLVPLEKLLGPGDIAEIAGVPLATVYSWRHRGGGPPALRVGKHVRYRPADVREWLAARVEP